VIPTAWAIILLFEVTVITVAAAVFVEEPVVVEINVGRDEKGGSVGVGRREFMGLSSR
jgi:hypothetical protein